MTADIATLGIRIDARQVRDADDALNRLTQTGQQTERAVEGVSGAFDRLKRMAEALAAALAVEELIKQADAWNNLQGQISLVADTQERLTQTSAALFDIAQRTRQGLKETVDLYTKISRSTESLNKTDADRLKVTETINKTLILSHASTQASAAALLQLGQAFSMGQLRGQELNSVLEETPGLARAIAAGMGKTTGDLKAMAEAGKLTGEAVFNSLQRVAGQVDGEFSKLPTTVGQATVQVENALLRTIGVFDQQNQLTHELAGGMSYVAENMDRFGRVAIALGAVSLALWFQKTTAAVIEHVVATQAGIAAGEHAAAVAVLRAGANVAAAEAELEAATAEQAAALGAIERAAAAARATVAVEALTVAEVELAAAQRGAAAVTGLGSMALGAMGGPLGLLTIVLGGAAAAWAFYGNTAKDANDKAQGATEKSTEHIIDELNAQQNKLLARIELAKQAGMKQTAQGGGEAADRLALLLASITVLQNQIADGTADAGAAGRLIDLKRNYDNLADAIKRVKGAQDTLNSKNDTEKFDSWLQKHSEYLDKKGKIAAAIKEAQKDLGDEAFNANKDKVTSLITTSFNKSDVDKAENSYKELLASIHEKIAASEMEIAVGRNATDAQKEQIKFDKELADGKIKLNATQRESVQAALDMMAVREKEAKAVQVQRDLAKASDDARIAQNEQAAGLAVAVADYGKISDAREIDMIAVKNLAELQRKLNDAYYQGIEYTPQQLVQMDEDTSARIKNEQAILGQNKALDYANQLRQQNQQFAVDYTLDPKAKAEAQLAIEKAMWQSKISLAAEGTQARELIESEYTQWLKNQQIRPQLDAQIAMWDSIEKTAHDTFTSILSSGKNAAQRLRDTLKNTLFDWLYQMTLKKWIVQIQGQLMGGAPAATGGTGDAFSAAASTSSNPLIQAVSAASSLYKAAAGIGDSISAAAGKGVSYLGDAIGNNSVSTFGKGMQGFGQDGSLGQAAGYGQTAGTVVQGLGNVAAGYMMGSTLNGAISGQYSTGSGMMTTEKIATAVASYFNPLLGAAVGAVSGLINRAFGMGSTELKASGLRGTLSASGATGNTYSDYHQDGGWFRSDKNWTDTKALTDAMSSQLVQAFQAIKDASGGFAKTLDANTDALSTYSKAFDITLTGDAAKDQAAVADFFKGVGDDVAKMLVPNLDSFSQSGETASATLERLAGEFTATTAAAQSLGKTAAEMFGSAGMGSAAARDRLVQLAGGTSALTSLADTFNKDFLTDAERLVPVSKALDAALGSLGLATIPKTKDEFKALVQSLDPTNESSAKLLVSLLQLSDAFNTVSQAADDAAKKARSDALDGLKRAVEEQKTTVKASYDAIVKGLTDAIDKTKASVTKLTGLSKSLHDALDKAGTEDMLRSEGQAQIRAALAIAKAGGPLPSADSLKNALGAVTQDSKNLFSTFEAYQRDRLQTAIDISDLSKVTDNQLSTADKQLAVLQAAKDAADAAYNAEVARLDDIVSTAQRQVDAVNGVDVSVQSVEQAVAALQALFGGSNAAAIVGAYGNALGRAPDAAGLSYWQGQAAAGMSNANITKGIGTSSEAASKLDDLYEKVFGRHGDSAGMSYWLQQLGNGTSLGQIEAAFRNSSEAKGNILSTPGSLASTSSGTTATIDTAAVSQAVADALKVPLAKIASYTQRTAKGIEDQNSGTTLADLQSA